MSHAQESFVQEFPEHLVSFKMIRIPDNDQHKNLYFSETEIPWEAFEIWALRMDQTPEQQVSDAHAVSRPSKPYAAIFIGFGHHGHPAICMSANAAELYCKWLREKTGRKYRLPTLDEWKYAAGKQPTSLEAAAWFWDNSDDTTHPVGTKAANEFGLKDMLGNAAEWTTCPEGPGIAGGSWKTKQSALSPDLWQPWDAKWNESDPQNPKSKWWLANGQFVGLRLVCEGPVK